MVELSARTKEVIARLFDRSAVPFVEQLLAEECGETLPLYKPVTPEGLERIQFAVLKISDGDQDTLLEALLLAKQDWRDVLVWADFANDLDAHNQWAKDLL